MVTVAVLVLQVGVGVIVAVRVRIRVAVVVPMVVSVGVALRCVRRIVCVSRVVIVSVVRVLPMRCVIGRPRRMWIVVAEQGLVPAIVRAGGGGPGSAFGRHEEL